MSSLTIRPESHMRTCTTIVGSDTSTELVEPSGDVTEKDIDALLQKIAHQDRESAALCFMGSMPPKCPENMYGSIYERVKKGPDTLCVIDSVNGLDYLLQSMAESPCKNSLLKINASEFCRLAGVAKSSNEADGVTLKELEHAVVAFLQTYKPAFKSLAGFAITDGKHPAHLVALDKTSSISSSATTTPKFRTYQIPIADLGDKKRVLYPIGAGDTVAAGTLAAWRSCQMMMLSDNDSHEKPTMNCLAANAQKALKSHLTTSEGVASEIREQHMVSAFAFGLACGSASCLKEENSVFDTEEALKLLDQMKPVVASL